MGTMKTEKTAPFLAELAKTLSDKHKDNFQNLTIVFPNRRAGLFFRKYLANYIEKPVWAPQILNIDEFVKSFSPLQGADHLTLLFLLFEAYNKVSPGRESFDQFYYWGELLLKDFNEIDKYLVKAKDLFSDLKDQKELEQRFDYLTPEQTEVIQSFWKSFGGKSSKHQQDFLQIWHLLERVYEEFGARLRAGNIGYDGLIFKSVAERALTGEFSSVTSKIIFAGFNALTKAEEIIITSFIKDANAEIYWDLDQYYYNDVNQEAGRFLRRYARDKDLGKNFPDEVPSYFKSEKKEIEIIGVPLAVGQAKLLGEVLEDQLKEIARFDPVKTAIVLPDEQMLFPVLHTLPSRFEEINITMGYPLKDTPVYGFLEQLLDLQQNSVIDKQTGNCSFYYENVLKLLKHPYLLIFEPKGTVDLVRDIEIKNYIYINEKDLKGTPLFNRILRQVGVDEVLDYLLDVLHIINSSLKNENERLVAIEKEYIFHFYAQLKRIREVVSVQKVQFTLPTFIKLFRQIIYALKLPFSGEPLNGLQVMGVLETRNLDFENVYLLSMNEGNFPPGINHSSFIPFNLRKGYNLPTYEHQDAIYAYHFYRLIQRAKRVFLFYNTENGIQTGGEMSRFLFQLRYESTAPVRERILSNPIQVPFPVSIAIKKDQSVLKKLNEYCTHGSEVAARKLTPSAFNTYLDCRLKFYFRYVVRLYESEAVEEEIDAATFGNLLHQTMETFYKNILSTKRNNLIQGDDLNNKLLLEKAVIDAFAAHFHWENKAEVQFEGRNLIVKEIIKKMATEILRNDERYLPFMIVSLEAEDGPYQTAIPVAGLDESERQVALKGIIDRVDKKDNVVRVIDYKTGKDNKRFENISGLFDRNNLKRNKAAMQTLIYAFLFHESTENKNSIITPGLYNARELFGNNFDLHLLIRDEGTKKCRPIVDARPYFEELKAEMGKLLGEIYNPDLTFDQTSNLRTCGYCPYAGICHR